jgi:hypothetical protein
MSNPSSTPKPKSRLAGWLTLPEWLRSNHIYRKKTLSQDSNSDTAWQTLTPEDRATPDVANIITSIVYDGPLLDEDKVKIHSPIIDLDIEHYYVESSTPGHGHLYLNVQLTHAELLDLLTTLHKYGIIGKGTLKQFERDGCISARIPGIRKGIDDVEPSNYNNGGYVPDPEPYTFSKHTKPVPPPPWEPGGYVNPGYNPYGNPW